MSQHYFSGPAGVDCSKCKISNVVGCPYIYDDCPYFDRKRECEKANKIYNESGQFSYRPQEKSEFLMVSE